MIPLYEALIERDEAAARRAIDAFDDDQQLFLAIARFAVLAYAPSQHAKHALLACLAAHDLREELGGRWRAMLTECAIYAGGSRLPWSEPPILEPPHVGGDAPLDTHDRLAAERWLASHIDVADFEERYFDAASRDFEDLGHKLIVSRAAWRLVPILGEKGKFATLRVGVWEWCAYHGEEHESHGRRADAGALVANVLANRGSLESTHAVFLYDAALGTAGEERALDYLAGIVSPGAAPHAAEAPALEPYQLARDYAQTLIAHAVAKRRPEFAPILGAVHENLDMNEGYEAWSFA